MRPDPGTRVAPGDSAGTVDWIAALTGWLASPARQLGTALAAAGVVAFLSASQLYVNWTGQGYEADYGALLAGEATEWILWALVFPLVLRLDERRGFGARPPGRAVVLHLTGAVLWFSIHNVALTQWSIRVDAAATGSFADLYLDRAVLKLPGALAVYCGMVGVGWAIRGGVRQSRLRRELVEAQLRNLRAQIRPHFLFNALHIVGSLVRSGRTEDAVATLVALSDLLRRSLKLSEMDRVPLREELAFARSYLDIQKTRFGERLSVAYRITPEAERVRVPVLVLQPLVENAIRHGVDPGQEGGCVEVAACLEGDRLVLTVSDSGNRGGTGDGGLGIGLENVRSRLRRIYGDGHALRLRHRSGGGSRVRVVIPVEPGSGPGG